LSAAHVPTDFRPPSAGRPGPRSKTQIRTHAIRQAVVLEVAGRLSDVVEDLDRAIQLALADGPRGVVCDLSAVFEGAEAGAIEMLATAGRHVRDWPAIPVAVACPELRIRESLASDHLGAQLIVTASKLPALTAVLASSVPTVEWLRLAPHPTASRASREFVARVLLGWGLGWVIPSASLAVSELVTNATIHAGTDIDLSVAWNLGALRLTVRDRHPGMPRQQKASLDPHGRGLSVVAGLSRAVGVLPTSEGGKVVWAVLNAPLPHPPSGPRRLEVVTTTR
jgi:hypothetical protein